MPTQIAFIRFYRYLATLLVLGIGSFSALAHANQWQVFGLSLTSQSELFCSATLIKKEGACRIITAAHCLSNETNTVTLRSESKASLTTANVMAIDRTKDLAWIEPNSNFLKNRCNQVQEVGKEIMWGRFNLVMSYFSYGVLNSGIVRLGTHDNTESFNYFKTDYIIKGQPGMKYTVALKPLQLLEGMSGGVLSDQFGNFLGINSQYEPHMDSSIFLPVEEVLIYIAAPSDKRNLDVQGLNRFKDRGPHGSNNHGDRTKGLPPASWQDTLKEMDEGVVLADGKILIGTGKYSVDGIDKWAMTKEMNNPIYREADGFPNESIRQKIIDRLTGHFYMSGAPITMKALQILPQPPFLQETDLRRHANLNIKITSSEVKMIFPFGLDLRSEQMIVTWTIEKSKNSKQIILKNKKANYELVCKNNNYLKLICRGQDEELSFSNPDSFKSIKMRWYKKIDPTKNDIMFFYGDLYGR